MPYCRHMPHTLRRHFSIFSFLRHCFISLLIDIARLSCFATMILRCWLPSSHTPRCHCRVIDYFHLLFSSAAEIISAPLLSLLILPPHDYADDTIFSRYAIRRCRCHFYYFSRHCHGADGGVVLPDVARCQASLRRFVAFSIDAYFAYFTLRLMPFLMPII